MVIKATMFCDAIKALNIVSEMIDEIDSNHSTENHKWNDIWNWQQSQHWT